MKNSPIRHADLIWTYHSVFGIVHTSGCHTCLLYIRHVATTSQSDNDTSFTLALKDRDVQKSTRFLSGVFEGGRLQQEYDDYNSDLLKRYKDERDEALDNASRQAAELLSIQEELRRVKEQFHALQCLFDEVADYSTRTELHLAEATTDFSGVPAMETRLEPLIGSTGRSYSSQSPTIGSFPLPPIEKLSTPSNFTSLRTSYLPSPPQTPENIFDVSLSPPLRIIDESVTVATEDHKVCHSPEERNRDSVLVQDSGIEACSSAPDLVVTGCIEDIKLLMDEARKPGNVKSLSKVRDLCTRAHCTPQKDRTELQRFILLNWKGLSPKPVTGDLMPNSADETAVAMHLTNGTEIFVDSSAWGIGFIMKGRWLAWELKPGWKTAGRDNNWAEMVAVELGLRVIIDAGFHSTTITLRSDNTGVIQALITRKSKHVQQKDILKRILELAGCYDIVLDPIWVPTKENLADKPSRGEFPSRALLFPTSPVIPAHLTGFLQYPVKSQSLSQ